MATIPKEFLETQGYSEFVTHPGKEPYSPTFQWSTVLRLLEEYATLQCEAKDNRIKELEKENKRLRIIASPPNNIDY